jgi:3-deoxy-D-manno-octulosonic-acid transferase
VSLLGIWRAATGAAAASGLPRLWMRGRPEERAERMGGAPDGAGRAPLWIHAASVGETAAAGALVAAVRRRTPRAIALSTTTATARVRARSLEPDVGPFHVPLDAPGPVARALERVQPSAFVTLETELWPTLLDELSRRGVPWGIASGRLTARGLARRRVVRGLYAAVLRRVAAIAARTPADARRFCELGAPPERVKVVGDLKEDRPVAAWEAPRADPPAWIAACTREGEEEIVLAALDLVARARPRGELLLAPRHPERFEEVARRCRGAGRAVRPWRERAAPPGAAWSVLLVDEMGVLDEAYRRASCAFVGGSLVAAGGHSPWEAAAAGRAVLTGPHVEHCRDAVESLRAAGGAFEVRGAGDLAARVQELLDDPGAAERAGRAAHSVLASRGGAGAATVEHFLAWGLLR